MDMKGNTILITGGGSGIGRALAESFHKLGNAVIIAGRRQKVLDEVTAANPGMSSAVLDVQDQSALKGFVTDIEQRFPALNVVINMAGIMKPENLNASVVDLSVMEETISTNLIAPIRLTTALLPLLRKQPKATVMTVTSGLAFLPLALTPTYCATKAAIHSWTQSLRFQLRDTSIEVLELAPPYVQTELMGAGQAADPRAMPLQEFVDEVMDILTNQPDAKEILVKRVHPLRYAEANGPEAYEAFFTQFNEAMASSGH